jgi:hypothetical protein
MEDANLIGYSINIIAINAELITLAGEQIGLEVNTGKGRKIKDIMYAVHIWKCRKITVVKKNRNEFTRFVLQTAISVNITVFLEFTPFNPI